MFCRFGHLLVVVVGGGVVGVIAIVVVAIVLISVVIVDVAVVVGWLSGSVSWLVDLLVVYIL